MASSQTSTRRLQYLDWLRGAAAIVMLQGHAFHSFLRNDLREGSAYMLSQFFGGMPPAVFLFLTGVTFAFLMDGQERRQTPAGERIRVSLKRAGYLFLLAFAFRLQLWLFGLPGNSWTDLFRVDILNCMGFAMVLLAPMSVFRTIERVRFCAVLGLAIAAASPLVSQVDMSAVHASVRAYIVPDYNFFSFFPWAAYLAFGMSAGSLIRIVRDEHMDRVMQWAAILGGVIVFGSLYFSNLPYTLYTKSEFWLNSPLQILIKQGVILMCLPVVYLWTRYGAAQGWSWVRQFGTTSLLVYWVHIELVYGRWLWFCKSGLNVLQTFLAAVGLILLMLALSTGKTYRHRIVQAWNSWKWSLPPQPDRVPGD